MRSDQKVDHVELPTRDLDAIRSFYEKVFGWEFTDCGPEYRAFCDGRIDGEFYRSGRCSATRRRAVLVVLDAADLEGTRETVLGSGGALRRDIWEFTGGRLFHFADPTGNDLAAWSDRSVLSREFAAYRGHGFARPARREKGAGRSCVASGQRSRRG